MLFIFWLHWERFFFFEAKCRCYFLAVCSWVFKNRNQNSNRSIKLKLWTFNAYVAPIGNIVDICSIFSSLFRFECHENKEILYGKWSYAPDNYCYCDVDNEWHLSTRTQPTNTYNLWFNKVMPHTIESADLFKSPLFNIVKSMFHWKVINR